MEGTNISNFTGESTSDHSYYGNGCPNAWGEHGEGGSTTACSTRIASTADGENQKNGTYYSFQASTSGSGAAVTTSNANSPDTFCPLGWQLPYSGTGGDYYDKSRSWNNLFGLYNIVLNETTGVSARKITSFPFSYIKGGYFAWLPDLGGRVFALDVTSQYYSSTSERSNTYFTLSIWNVLPTHVVGGHDGKPLRCHFSNNILNIKHNWYILKP